MLRTIWSRGFALSLVISAVAALAGASPSAAQIYESGGQSFAFSGSNTWAGLYVGGHLGGSVNDDNDGIAGGGTVGFNTRAGQLVVGGEADFSTTTIDGSGIDIDWLWTVRGRLGLPLGNGAMPFVTAGLAIADVDATAGGVTESETKTGFTVGGGAEFRLSQNWSIKGEYLYVDLGRHRRRDCSNNQHRR